MRLRQSRIKRYSHRQAIPKKDNRGNSVRRVWAARFALKTEVWPAQEEAAGGKFRGGGPRSELPDHAGYEVIADEKAVSVIRLEI